MEAKLAELAAHGAGRLLGECKPDPFADDLGQGVWFGNQRRIDGGRRGRMVSGGGGHTDCADWQNERGAFWRAGGTSEEGEGDQEGEAARRSGCSVWRRGGAGRGGDRSKVDFDGRRAMGRVSVKVLAKGVRL